MANNRLSGRNARPFSSREVDSTYFKNLFKEALVGERPVLGTQVATANDATGEEKQRLQATVGIVVNHRA